jgi:AraC family transcriptional regulator of arabinose operon
VSRDARIEYALYVIEQRMAERVSIHDLAALVDLSPSRFAHLFRLSVGTSPLRYLRRLRIERARELLEATSLPVREVMLQVGFTDASHFSKDFRARFGTGPREYRTGCRAAAVQERAR